MPVYRLPLELELHILELATPPLLLDRIRQRVKLLRQIALVHRSFTKWAQDKLHGQLVYTFRGRVGEQERLQDRLTAGFGPPASGMLLRLYLDLRAWDREGEWNLQLLDDLGEPEDVAQRANEVGKKISEIGGMASGPCCDPLELLRPWGQALASVWVLVPDFAAQGQTALFQGVQYLEVDDHAWSGAVWGDQAAILPTCLTTLVLRDVTLKTSAPRLPNLQVLVLIRSSIELDYEQAVAAFPALHVFESIASDPILHPDELTFFRQIARTARFYRRTCPVPTTDGSLADEIPPTCPPRLETCTFTWLEAPPIPSSSADPLVELRSALEAAVGNVPLIIECFRSDATEEETIGRILENLVV